MVIIFFFFFLAIASTLKVGGVQSLALLTIFFISKRDSSCRDHFTIFIKIEFCNECKSFKFTCLRHK